MLCGSEVDPVLRKGMERVDFLDEVIIRTEMARNAFKIEILKKRLHSVRSLAKIIVGITVDLKYERN